MHYNDAISHLLIFMQCHIRTPIGMYIKHITFLHKVNSKTVFVFQTMTGVNRLCINRFFFCISIWDRIWESYGFLCNQSRDNNHLQEAGRDQVVITKPKIYSISHCTYCKGTLNCKILSAVKMVLSITYNKNL